ncbi:MAG: SDR family oxidoreductase [Anaerolineae bacterium]|nr:SDR family oxidoreductase [Anaerolineae bacterium]
MQVEMNAVDLKGQVALVTGGGRGLGQGMARALAAAHASVAVTGRSESHLKNTVDLIQAAGGQAVAVAADVTDSAAVERMVRTVEGRLGPVSILVNNAGVTGRPGPTWEVDVDDWQRTFAVNVGGAFFCTRAVLPGMIAQRQGRIIHVASGAGLFGLAYGSQYCASKAALIRLSECVAAETKDYGICVFAINPGNVRTDMTEYLMSSEEGQTYLPWFRQLMLAGRDVPAELSASLVVQLASGQLDALSGRFINAEGDLPQLLNHADRIQEQDLYTLRLRTLPD